MATRRHSHHSFDEDEHFEDVADDFQSAYSDSSACDESCKTVPAPSRLPSHPNKAGTKTSTVPASDRPSQIPKPASVTGAAVVATQQAGAKLASAGSGAAAALAAAAGVEVEVPEATEEDDGRLGVLIGDEQVLPLTELPRAWSPSQRRQDADEPHELRALQQRNDALYKAKLEADEESRRAREEALLPPELRGKKRGGLLCGCMAAPRVKA